MRKGALVVSLLLAVLLTSAAKVHHKRGHQDVWMNLPKSIKCGELYNWLNDMEVLRSLSQNSDDPDTPYWTFRQENQYEYFLWAYKIRCREA